MKEVKRSTDTVESLQNDIASNQEKIRQLKRANSEFKLKDCYELVMSDKRADIKQVIDACYDYIAQHRALLKTKQGITGYDE